VATVGQEVMRAQAQISRDQRHVTAPGGQAFQRLKPAPRCVSGQNPVVRAEPAGQR
jgi:hypothetical protein